MSHAETDIPHDSIDSCCKGSVVGLSLDGSVLKIVPTYCHRWQCPRCSKTKTALWRTIAGHGEAERFITLTLRHEENGDAWLQADRLKKAFAKLVQKIRKVWGEFEYLLVFELTKKGTPHVHILQRGVFVPQHWLSDEWNKLTGAFKVDIRRIKHTADAANYITKYMGKAIGHVADVLTGLRIVQRSKNWILPRYIKDDSGGPSDPDLALEWVYIHKPPTDIKWKAIEYLGASVDKEKSGESLVMRAPPRPDLLDILSWFCKDTREPDSWDT